MRWNSSRGPGRAWVGLLAALCVPGVAGASSFEGADRVLVLEEICGIPPSAGLTVAVAFAPDFTDERPSSVAVVVAGEERVVALLDDGQPPDLRPSDGVSVAFFPGLPSASAVRVRLLLPDGQEYFGDTIPLVEGSSAPSLGLVLTGARLRVLVGSGGAGGADAGGPPPPPGGEGAPPEGPGGGGGELLPLGVFGGLGVGLVAGWWLGRRREEPGLVPLSAPAPWPAGPQPGASGRLDLQVVAQEREEIVRLLVALFARRRPVLVCGRAPDAGWGESPAMGLVDQRPSAEAVVLAARSLMPLGRPLVVVPEAEAIEEPGEDEELDDVLDDVPGLAEGALDLISLRLDRGLPVHARDGHLVDPQGVRLWDPDAGGEGAQPREE